MNYSSHILTQIRSAAKEESNYSVGLERRKDKAKDELPRKTLN